MQTLMKSKVALCSALVLAAVGLFQNCSRVHFNDPSVASLSSESSVVVHSAQIAVSASKPNPPLDLFFIVDNSASMAGHQIDLGKNFASIFTSNAANLSNFDTTVYVFSTTSTVHSNFSGLIPSQNPGAVTQLPAISLISTPSVSNLSQLISLPGGIFGLWHGDQGTYAKAGFSTQYFPSPTLGVDPSGGITQSLFMSRIGSLSTNDYQSRAQTLTRLFQQRLAQLSPENYINTSAQSSLSPATDVSSGLCTMARILKHAKDQAFVKDGDAAAFILVSDDNDRLNSRNPNNNQCLETYAYQANVVDGMCAQHQFSVSYNSSATVTYANASNFNYTNTGTRLPYTYDTGKEACAIKYAGGTNYSYTSKYTQLQTQVTYQKCSQAVSNTDGTCIAPTKATTTVRGNFVKGGATCTQTDMSNLVADAAPGTTFSCAPANQDQLTGNAGVDSASDGTNCSPTVLANLQSDSTHANVTCAIVANSASTQYQTKQLSGVTAGTCAAFCAANSAQYPQCAASTPTRETASGTFAFNVDGVTCASTCPDGAQCGSGTIANYLGQKYGASAGCGSPYTTSSSISVNAVSPLNGAALACASPLGGLKVTSNGQTVCQTATTIDACIQSLRQNTAAASTCSSSGTGQATVAANIPNVTCATSCSNSGGICNTSTYATVGAYIAGALNGYCRSNQNGGTKSFAVTLNENAITNAGCQTKCSDLASGSCDGKGWGAGDGSTLGTYVSSLSPGATCTAGDVYLANDPKGTPANGIPLTASAAYCATNVSYPFFRASNNGYVSTAQTFTAGDGSHKAADLQSYILAQAQSVFSANNLPSVAVITQRPGDNLPGTDVGADYIALTGTNLFNSAQVTDIGGNYADSLSQVSNFIQKQAQNNFVLSVPSDAKLIAVSVLHAGRTVWTPLAAADWSFSGSTLSLSASAQLQVGDQLRYQYSSAF